MAAATVNLDALIRRDDFSMDATSAGGSPRTNIALTDLDSGFFSASLRKPDFQRETTHWTPQKIVDLVRAFITTDLIPAVILWQRGSEIFVIDGAHRLSALMAWVADDYGDGKFSNAHFGNQIPDEQKRIAAKTRALMRSQVGSYAEFVGLKQSRDILPADKQAQLTALGNNSVVVQWVNATNTEAAEKSFFKINQAAQPIDPTERMILQSRSSPNAIAARCIVRGGKGHKYWKSFSESVQIEIERLGAEIYQHLYSPPLQEPIKTLDIPVAGQGYNTLPFAFSLVNVANDIPLPKTEKDKAVSKPKPSEVDGHTTVSYLKKVLKDISLVTTNSPGSLGFHPAVYFYANSGAFLPVAFLAAVEFAKDLDQTNKKKEFTAARSATEKYLFDNKAFISLTITRLGSGSRSLGRVKELFSRVFLGFSAGKSADEITQEFLADNAFSHFAQAKIPSPRQADGPSPKGKIAASTKSAVYIRDAMPRAVRCSICDAALHSNSITFDHSQRRRDGGSGESSNLTMTHPFCNSGVKN